MIKLNRRGFTLIELLAVVVIMAVILVVTIPSVLTSMNDAKEKQLQNATQAVEDWYTKQNELSILGDTLGTESVDQAYLNFKENDYSSSSRKNFFDYNPDGLSQLPGEAALKAAGISNVSENIDLSKSTIWRSGTTKKICIVLVAKQGGNFYNTDTTKNKKCSSGCPASTCA